jgi:hypothetical protein
MSLKRKASSCSATMNPITKFLKPVNASTRSRTPEVVIEDPPPTLPPQTLPETTSPSDPCVGKCLYEFNKHPIQPRVENPKVKGKRPFSENWYKEYPWIEYSVSQKSAFCHTCRCFGISEGTNNPTRDAFITIGFSDWPHATRAFKKHEATACHVNATIALKNRRMQDNNESLSINCELSMYRQEKVQKNREYIKRIVEIALFIGKQGLAFRGHRENETECNRGNFLELLDFRCQDVPILQDKDRAGKYITPTAQNEIVELLGDSVVGKIQAEIRDRPFSIILDETPDVSHHEQVAVCFRYCNDDLKPVERFVKFQRTTNTTGEALESVALSAISDLGLSAESYLVGQGYDGCSNMSGIHNGVAARIRAKIPRAL